jgi:hypothetical protein
MFNINNLTSNSKEQLENIVVSLASHLQQGKKLAHVEESTNKSVNTCYLQVLDQQTTTDTPKVLADLNAILLTSIEKGLDESHQNELDTIRNIRDQIISTLSSESKSYNINDMPIEITDRILSLIPARKRGRVKPVKKQWNELPAANLINIINEEKICFKEVFPNMNNAREIINKLIENPACKSLEYADFKFMDNKLMNVIPDFDKDCLKLLTKNCPLLKHLIIPRSKINTLVYLVNIPKLENLDITLCQLLEPDSLNHLVNTPNLLNLNISLCQSLEADALKNLMHTKNLQYLNIFGCIKLEADALKNLVHTKNLQYLNICGCSQFKVDSLKFLVNTPKLKSIEVLEIDPLDRNELKKFPNNIKIDDVNND